MISISSPKPSTAGFSHNGGWTQALLDIIPNKFGHNCSVEIIEDPNAIHEFDTIIINEGINYKKGSWNFFGGVQQHTIDKINALEHYKGLLVSFNEGIDWKSLFKRKELQERDMPEVQISYTHKNGPRIIIGDSHSLSIYRSGYSISRNDGATLFGALKEGGILRNFDFNGISHVELYFGNIDVRFHIWRQPDVTAAMNRLIFDYLQFAKELVKQGKNVTIQGLLPIEDESRKIPGTGKYKGENFYGTREERQAAVDYINGKLERLSITYGIFYRSWKGYLPKDGFEAPKFPAMEARQSVHLRPDYYLFKNKNNGKNEATLF